MFKPKGSNHFEYSSRISKLILYKFTSIVETLELFSKAVLVSLFGYSILLILNTYSN